MSLSNKRRVFVEEYLKCFNASEAARRAGYRGKPNVIGSRLLAIDNIKDEIRRRLAEKVMSADETLSRISDQARFDPGPFVIQHPEHKELVVDWDKLVAAGLTHLVKAVYLTKFGTRIEFHDTQHALELIGKHHKLFVERQEISGAGGGPIKTETHVKLSELTDDELNTLAAIARRTTGD